MLNIGSFRDDALKSCWDSSREIKIMEHICIVDCGGVINIDYVSASPEVFYVEYKLDTLYDDNEFCVWTINSTGSIWDTLEVTLIEEGFEQGRDGLDTYYLDFESTSSSTLGQCTL